MPPLSPVQLPAAPWLLLAVAMLLIAAVLVIDRWIGRRRGRRLRRLAEHNGFRFSRIDRFDLAARVAPHLPAGAADVVVRDLMYRSAPGGQDYAFTAVFAVDARARVVMQAQERGDGVLRNVSTADAALPLGEQYRRLLGPA